MSGPFKHDARRRNHYQPGELITSVQIDTDKMECFFCFRFWPFFCCKASHAQATYMDIYTNSVVSGMPFFCCYTCSKPMTSIAVTSHYDDPAVHGGMAQKGECFGPFPFCCIDCCGFCGEVLVFRGTCCTGARMFAMGNQGSTGSICPLIAWFCPISVMYGLAPGEASRAAAIINTQVANFRNSQWTPEMKIAEAMGMGSRNPTPMVVINNAAPGYAHPPQQKYSPTDPML